MTFVGKDKNNGSSAALILAYVLVPQSELRKETKPDTEEG